MILGTTVFGGKVTYTEMPVFKPNDYFFKHHQKEGEEQWETFARVLRDIMAKTGNLKISELSIEDKFKYKELLNPKIAAGKVKASY